MSRVEGLQIADIMDDMNNGTTIMFTYRSGLQNATPGDKYEVYSYYGTFTRAMLTLFDSWHLKSLQRNPLWTVELVHSSWEWPVSDLLMAWFRGTLEFNMLQYRDDFRMQPWLLDSAVSNALPLRSQGDHLGKLCASNTIDDARRLGDLRCLERVFLETLNTPG